MTHGSKCRSIHGHRGTIEVTCAGADLHKSGEQSEMVVDFGFLKNVMMEVIDRAIDHGFVACLDDHELLRHFIPDQMDRDQARTEITSSIDQKGYWLSTEDGSRLKTLLGTKLYVIPYIPTSERLAQHFFERMKLPVRQQSGGIGELTNLRFWETPNCYCDYPGFPRDDG